jgi:hypothetical protein
VDDGGVEKIGLTQLQHRAGKDGLKTAIRLPPSKCAASWRKHTTRWADIRSA